MIIQDLSDARILVELRDRLNFAEVARTLRIPAATVSRRLMRMETRAGVRLFDRTTRSVSATEAGRLAAGHAEKMLGEAEAVDLSLDTMRKTPVGTVRATTPVIFGQALLGPVVVAFLKAYPACDLAIDLSDRHADLVEENYDVAIRIGPPGDESLVVKPLGLVEAGLYRSPAMGPASATIADPEALARAPVGLLHGGEGAKPMLKLTSANGHEACVPLTPRLVCMNPWLLRDVAVSSDLVVVLPGIIGDPAVRAGDLERVLPGWFARRVPIHLAFTSRRLIRPAVRSFVDLAARAIPDLLKSAEPVRRLHASV
ncbi:MAG: LysR substrate-binding domain-containing protein [Inquilinaceae bacterium]